MTLLAEVCARLGDVARAEELYEPLLPYAGRNVVVGRATTCNGSASRLLGMLAATRGDTAQAERHFRDALAMNAAMGARPLVARTQLAWAEALLARGEGDDVARARGLLAEAIVTADALGLVAVAGRARSLVGAPRGLITSAGARAARCRARTRPPRGPARRRRGPRSSAAAALARAWSGSARPG